MLVAGLVLAEVALHLVTPRRVDSPGDHTREKFAIPIALPADGRTGAVMTNTSSSDMRAFMSVRESHPTTRQPRINRGKLIVDVLAEEGYSVSVRDANGLLAWRIDQIAAHVGVTRAHLLRQYVDETWVLNFARGIARTMRELDNDGEPGTGVEPAAAAV